MLDGNKQLVDRRLFLKATSSAALSGAIAGNASASRNRRKVARCRFIETGVEYITDAKIHVDHIDRLGTYYIGSSTDELLLKTSDERMTEPFKKYQTVIAGPKFNALPFIWDGSSRTVLPTKLNKSLYSTESIPLSETANLPSAKVESEGGIVQAQLGKQKRRVESSDEVRLIGESYEVLVPKPADHTSTHSGGPTKAEKSGTSADSGNESPSRKIRVRPELVVRNHGQRDVYTSESGGGA